MRQVKAVSGKPKGSPPRDPSGVPGNGSDDSRGSEALFDHWRATRHGARARRGFHFQDMVGAWLAARVATGDVNADVLVPEGFEDMSTEGHYSLHYQIKSRVRHLDRFPVGEASQHVLDAWENHLSRPDDGGVLVVVLERGIRGEETLNDFDRPLDEALAQDSAFRDKLCLRGQERGLDLAAIDDLLSSTIVVGVSWEEVTSATAAQIASLETVSLPPSRAEGCC